MSKKAGGQVDHIFRKYPELLNAFDVIDNSHSDNDDHDSKRDVGFKRILRKHVARSRKAQTAKRAPNSRIKRFESRTLSRIECRGDSDKKKLFTCPICRDVLETPVTVLCGHTFCKACLDRINCGKCFECETDIEIFGSTNILVQDIIDKWKEIHKPDALPELDRKAKGDGGGNECRAILEKSRYCLRSRCNGLHGNSPLVSDVNDIKKYQRTLTSDYLKQSQGTWSNITASDLECILCSQCLLSPVTTTCGHTFCRECLARVLDHGLACPLCMTPLKTIEQYRGETAVLTQALCTLVAEDHDERLATSQQVIENLESSNQIPIFICTNALPKVACPLFVYEPRYRLLTRRSLQSSKKRFGMAAKTAPGDKFALYGTLLEIRDCISFPDGTSILTTIGLRRFKVLSKGEQDGYDTATVQYIRDALVTVDKLASLMELHERVYSKTIRWLQTLKPRLLAEIERCIGCMPALEEDWLSLPDGPTWTWWLIAILPLSMQLRVGFLASTSLEKRLLAVEKMLDHLKLKMKAVEKNALNCTDNEERTESCNYTERSVDISYQVNE